MTVQTIAEIEREQALTLALTDADRFATGDNWRADLPASADALAAACRSVGWQPDDPIPVMLIAGTPRDRRNYASQLCYRREAVINARAERIAAEFALTPIARHHLDGKDDRAYTIARNGEIVGRVSSHRSESWRTSGRIRTSVIGNPKTWGWEATNETYQRLWRANFLRHRALRQDTRKAALLDLAKKLARLEIDEEMNPGKTTTAV